jgi:hypothetical protein
MTAKRPFHTRRCDLPFPAVVAGWRHRADGAGAAIGDVVMAVHEQECVADLCAVAVHTAGGRIGYLPRAQAADVVARFGAGVILGGVVTSVDDTDATAPGRPRIELREKAERRSPIPLGVTVRTRSGLTVGTLLAHHGATVDVEGADGTVRTFPAARLTVTATAVTARPQ